MGVGRRVSCTRLRTVACCSLRVRFAMEQRDQPGGGGGGGGSRDRDDRAQEHPTSDTDRRSSSRDRRRDRSTSRDRRRDRSTSHDRRRDRSSSHDRKDSTSSSKSVTGEKRRRSHSSSSSGSSSDSAYSSDDSSDDSSSRHKHKRRKKDTKKKDKHKHKHRVCDRAPSQSVVRVSDWRARTQDKKKDKHKKHKKDKKHKSSDSSSSSSSAARGPCREYGSWGVLQYVSNVHIGATHSNPPASHALGTRYQPSIDRSRDCDIFKKDHEFTSWLEEVKHVNSEALSLKDRKELFASYKEDYNTCTLPSLKYVDINMWEREEALKKAQAAAEKAAKYVSSLCHTIPYQCGSLTRSRSYPLAE